MRDLYDFIKTYTDGDAYPFHMPGHKRSGAVSFGAPFLVDITEIDGFDNLHHPEGILKEAEEEAARILGSRKTLFQVNGSSGGLLSAVYAATDYGDGILLARNCHKAVYNAVSLRGLKPRYLYPDRDPDTGIAGPVTEAQVRAALKAAGGVKAVVLVSPNYEGVTGELRGIAEAVHEAGAVLIVDEAHGAHLPFCRGLGFPGTALDGGADLVVQSLHKTMPALTQTALLHQNSGRVSEERIREAAGMFQTSSPSYVLMASIVRALIWGEENRAAFLAYAKRLDRFRERACGWNCLRLFDGGRPGWQTDPGKLVVWDHSGQMNGRTLYDRLREVYRLQPEMCTERYVVLMTSPADREDGYHRLSEALDGIDRELAAAAESRDLGERPGEVWIPEAEPVWTPGEAEGKQKESVIWEEAAGRVAGEYVYLYPPEIPLLVPGERIPPDMGRRLADYRKAGLSVQGMREPDRIRVLCGD
jgi:arginine decarboxylase